MLVPGSCIKEMEWEDLDQVHVAQDKNRWWDAVNTAIKLHVLQNTGDFRTNERLPASQGRLCSIII